MRQHAFEAVAHVEMLRHVLERWSEIDAGSAESMLDAAAVTAEQRAQLGEMFSPER